MKTIARLSDKTSIIEISQTTAGVVVTETVAGVVESTQTVETLSAAIKLIV